MTLAPFGWLLWTAGHELPRLASGTFPYLWPLGDPYLWLALRNTLGLTAVAVTIELAAGCGLALLFRGRLPGSGGMRFVILVPMMCSPLLVGLFWKFMFDQVFGVATWLLALGLGDRPSVLTSTAAALGAIVVVDVWQWTPLVFLLCTAGLQGMPPEQEEAAILERASPWRRLHRLVLPHLKPALALAGLYRGIDAMRMFDLVYILTGGGPGDSTVTLPLLVYRQGFQFFDAGKAAILALLLLVLVNGLVALALRRIDRRPAAAIA